MVDEQNKELVKKFALCAYKKYFSDGLDIQSKNNVATIFSDFGLDYKKCLQAIDAKFYIEKLKLVGAGAIKRNVCGLPFIFIGNEHFWGNDRLYIVGECLQSNGW